MNFMYCSNNEIDHRLELIGQGVINQTKLLTILLTILFQEQPKDNKKLFIITIIN